VVSTLSRLTGKRRDGIFRPWVKERCGYGKDTAYKAIQAYKVFGKRLPDRHFFEPTALYLLSAESCPKEVTEEAIARATNR